MHLLRLGFILGLLGLSLNSLSAVAEAAVSQADAEIFLQNCSTIECSEVARREQVISYNPKNPPESLTLLLPFEESSANLSIFSLEQIDLQSLLLNYDLFPQLVQRNGKKYYAIYIKAPRNPSAVASLSMSYKLTFTWLTPDKDDGVDYGLAMTVQPAAGATRGGDQKAAIAYVLFREAVIIGNSVDKSQSAAASPSACSNSLQVPDRRSIAAHWIILAAMILLIFWMRLCRVRQISPNKNAD